EARNSRAWRSRDCLTRGLLPQRAAQETPIFQIAQAASADAAILEMTFPRSATGVLVRYQEGAASGRPWHPSTSWHPASAPGEKCGREEESGCRRRTSKRKSAAKTLPPCRAAQ